MKMYAIKVDGEIRDIRPDEEEAKIVARRTWPGLEYLEIVPVEVREIKGGET